MRLRPQFSLRTLLITTLVVGVGIGTYSTWSRQVAALYQHITEGPPVPWQPFSAKTVREAKASGRPVLIFFYADWDIVCGAMMKPYYDEPEMRNLIAEHGIIPILADCSERNSEIEDEFRAHGPLTVPTTIVHFPHEQQPPIVLKGIASEAQVRVALQTAVAGQPRTSRWQTASAPLLGAVGILLMIALTHFLARTQHES